MVLIVTYGAYRHIRRDIRFYLKQIPCKVALIRDSLDVEVWRLTTRHDTDTIEHKTFFFLSKPVPLSISPANGNYEQSIVTYSSYFAFVGLESSETLKPNFTPPSTHQSRYSSSLDLGTSSKNEKSGTKFSHAFKHNAFHFLSFSKAHLVLNFSMEALSSVAIPIHQE